MKRITVLAFVLSGMLVNAQRNVTIEEATLTAQRGFATQMVYSAKWRINDAVTYTEAPYNALTEKKNNGDTNNRFLTTEELQKALSEKSRKEIQLSMMPFNYHWESENEYSFTYNGSEIGRASGRERR